MNISFENPDKVNGLLTITVEESDFQDSVEKTLKDYRKKANIPGFRPGQAPMGLIKRQFGASVRYDAVNKFVGEQLYKYIKVDEQKDLFKGAKLGDIITFNPRKAYPEGEAEISALLKIDREVAKELESDFSYQITEISRYNKAEINQDLFDQVFGKDEVKSEEEFRNKIAESLKPQLETNSNFKFLLDVREYCEKKVGELTWPDALLKRVMLMNNQDKGEEFVEKNYAESIKQLEWHLIKEQLVKAAEVKVEDADIREAAKEMARMQFAQYGMTSIPEEYIENYANELLKKREAVDNFVERAIDVKLAAALKNTVTLNEKEITLDEFNEMMK